jgi:hypothetical protein
MSHSDIDSGHKGSTRVTQPTRSNEANELNNGAAIPLPNPTSNPTGEKTRLFTN